MNKSVRVFISGGQGGLARACHQYFDRLGWVVDAPSRHELDMECMSDIERWFAERPSYDVIICNAGVTKDQLFLKQTPGVWDEVMQVNLKAAAWVARGAILSLSPEQRHSTSVFFIGSYAAVHPKRSQCLYATSKAALEGLMKSLAQEWGEKNVRVNLVLPGFMVTPMTESLSSDLIQRAKDLHCLDHFNEAEHVAKFIAFLHQSMPHTSGQCFNLDSRIL